MPGEGSGISHCGVVAHLCKTGVGCEHDANMPHCVAANCKVLRLEAFHQIGLVEFDGLSMTYEEFWRADDVLAVDHTQQAHLRVLLQVIVGHDHKERKRWMQ